MEDYYLIAMDENPKVIPFTTKHLDFISLADDMTHYKIFYIDYITSKYKEEEIEKLFNYPSSKLMIYHRHKYKGNTNVKVFDIFTKENTPDTFKNIIDKKMKNQDILVSDCESIIKAFCNKLRNEEFVKFSKYSYANINEHSIKLIKIINSKLYNSKKDSVRRETIDYNIIRSMMCLINLYNKYKTYENYLKRDEYVYLYNIENKKVLDDLTNSKIVDGQISIFDMQKEDIDKKQGEADMDNNSIEYLNHLLDEIKSSPWDDDYMRECFEKNIFPRDYLNRMTLKDKVRAGVIDIVEYLRLSRLEDKGKRK